MNPIERFPSGFSLGARLNAAFKIMFEIDACTRRNCWSIQTRFVSIQICSTAWYKNSWWSRTPCRYSSHIPWTIVHLTGHVKKQYGKNFPWRVSNLVWSAALMLSWQSGKTELGINLINHRHFMEIFWFSGIYSNHRFFMENCLGPWWSAYDLRFPRAKVWGQSYYVHRPGLPSFWSFPSPGRNRCCVTWITVSFGNTIF